MNNPQDYLKRYPNGLPGYSTFPDINNASEAAKTYGIRSYTEVGGWKIDFWCETEQAALTLVETLTPFGSVHFHNWTEGFYVSFIEVDEGQIEAVIASIEGGAS